MIRRERDQELSSTGWWRFIDLLDQQSFFTVGEDEVRAWTTRRQATALEAASRSTPISPRDLSGPKWSPARTSEMGGMAKQVQGQT